MAMWILQLSLITAACGCIGWLATRMGQSKVVGELAAGILLGPAVLGALAPGLQTAIFRPGVSAGMAQLGEVGVIALMFKIGLHLHLSATPNASRSKAMAPAIVIAALGMLLPMAGGVVIGYLSHDALAPQIAELPYWLFCGVALSVSALPVMARIVIDTEIADAPPAVLSLSAAMLTDVAGWIALAFVSAVAVAGESGNVSGAWKIVMSLAALLAVSKCAARFVVAPLAADAMKNASYARLMAIVVSYVLASAWATAEVGIHSAFGALLAGVMLRGVPGLKAQWEQRMDGFVSDVLLPVFFVYSGLHVTFGSMAGISIWAWFVPFLCVACGGKFGGSYLGARISGLTQSDAALVGSLMNTRGLVELVVLAVGLEIHALSQSAYGVLLLVALTTTVMTTPFVRLWRRAALRTT